MYRPTVIDHNRADHGDYYKKPTQYFFINLEPQNNNVKYTKNNNARRIEDNNTVERSMISPNYIDWFIKHYILAPEEIKGEWKAEDNGIQIELKL